MPVIPKTTRSVRIRVMAAKDGQFYFVVRAANGEPIAVSETYTRRRDAERGARRFRDLVTLAEIDA